MPQSETDSPRQAEAAGVMVLMRNFPPSTVVMGVSAREVTRLVDRLERRRRLISFKEITNAWVKGAGEGSELGLRGEAYAKLRESIASGEFQIGNQTKVWLLKPGMVLPRVGRSLSGWPRMSPRVSELFCSYLTDVADLFANCWTTKELAALWLSKRGRAIPDWSMPHGAQVSSSALKIPTGRPPRTRDMAQAALSKAFPVGLPDPKDPHWTNQAIIDHARAGMANPIPSVDTFKKALKLLRAGRATQKSQN